MSFSRFLVFTLFVVSTFISYGNAKEFVIDFKEDFQSKTDFFTVRSTCNYGFENNKYIPPCGPRNGETNERGFWSACNHDCNLDIYLSGGITLKNIELSMLTLGSGIVVISANQRQIGLYNSTSWNKFPLNVPSINEIKEIWLDIPVSSIDVNWAIIDKVYLTFDSDDEETTTNTPTTTTPTTTTPTTTTTTTTTTPTTTRTTTTTTPTTTTPTTTKPTTTTPTTTTPTTTTPTTTTPKPTTTTMTTTRTTTPKPTTTTTTATTTPSTTTTTTTTPAPCSSSSEDC